MTPPTLFVPCVQTTVNQRDNSIDIARGICIFFVIIYHSECYFETSIHLYPFFAPFYLTTFFFISGRYIVNHAHPVTFIKKLKRIFSTLLWPYLVFTTLIWLPKAYAHGQAMNVKDAAIDILGGTASWFIAALVIGEILFYALYKLVHNEYILLGCGFVLMAIGFYLQAIDLNPFPWYYKEGMINIIYICIGYLFGIHYKKFSKILSFKKSAFVLVATYIIVFAFQHYLVALELYSGIISHVIALILALSGILSVLKISEYIGRQRVLEYIGCNSIFYYFLNGGAILIASKILIRINCPHYYIINILIVLFATTIITLVIWLISRYAPFLKRFPATW